MPEDCSPSHTREPSITTPDGVQAWLVSAVSEATGIHPTAVDPERPLAEFGLGSRQLVTLVARLKVLTGIELEPSLLFNHPTIAGVARAVYTTPSTAAASADQAVTPSASGDEVAIISMACHYPGSGEGSEDLWQLLTAGKDAIREVPVGRWNTSGLYSSDPEITGTAYSLQGGFLDRSIDGFDSAFFGISSREAAAMDPQHRLLLQTSWETFERAGILPESLNGSSTGVYIGLYDSGYLASASLGQLDGHLVTGTSPSVASGRIAYTLGLQGPAITVDTACSSSLVALHLAASALARGECDLALAGGATLLITPRGHVEFSRLRGLSPSGRCSPFSAAADGVVWAEGCGLVLLKRLADACRDGDRILAVVKGSAINQDGRSQGLSAPNGPAQERVLQAALDAAGLTAQDLDYVEAHGTGTPLGDPIELGALARVFGPGRSPDRPLGVGSLKSNIGHTQAAAGIGSVIKTVLALTHERIPASLHADIPTDPIDWTRSGLRILTESEAWPRSDHRVRRAGVSAFGISGTNAHVVLEEGPRLPDESSRAGSRLPSLYPLSARSLTALRGQSARLLRTIEAHPELPLSAISATLAHHRTHFDHRAVVHATDRSGLLNALEALANGKPCPGYTSGPRRTAPTGKVAFVFPGQGSQWVGMARDLLDVDPVFTRQFERCDTALRSFTQWSVLGVLRGDNDAPSLERVDVIQPVLFALMVSLAAMWRARGVVPDAVIGHSQGEVAAAYVAGALSLNDAAAVMASRSRALTRLSSTGAMAVIALPHTDVAALLGGGITIAAVNSGRATVVAGPVEPIQDLVRSLEARQVFVRRLDVNYASHSTLVEPVRTPILEALHGITTHPTGIAWYSTVTAAPVTGQLTAHYWYDNLRKTVCFASAAERMLADGYRHFVELSPHPSLITALRTIGEDSDHDLTAVGSLRRDEDSSACLAQAAAELHTRGGQIDWLSLVADHGTTDLPTYAWDEDRHWTEPGQALDSPGPFDRAGHPLLGIQLESADESRWIFRTEWSPASAGWLSDHTIFGHVVVSATTLLELCRAALAVARPGSSADVTDLLLLSPLVLRSVGTVEISVEVATAAPTPEVTVHSRSRGQDSADWTLHATASGTISSPFTADRPPPWPEDADEAWPAQTYEQLAALGLEYGPAFQGVRSAVVISQDEILARLSLPPVARNTADPYPLHPALTDAALQAAAVFGLGNGRVLLPVAVGRCILPLGGFDGFGDMTALVRRTGGSATDLTFDVTLWDADGLPVGRLEAVRLRAADPADVAQSSENARHLYEVVWTVVPPTGKATRQCTWAVTGDQADPQVKAAHQDLVRGDSNADVVVRFWPTPPSDADPVVLAHKYAAEALAELQTLINLPAGQAATRSIWVTRSAIAAASGDTARGYAQSTIWGLVRSARAEHPGLGLTLLDLDEGDPVSALTATAELPQEPELAVRAAELLAPRLVRARASEVLRVPSGDQYELNELSGHVGLRPMESAALTLGEVRIQIHAMAVQKPGDPLTCAGIVSEVAPDVTDFVPGNRVVALTDTQPGSEAVAPAANVTVLENSTSFTAGVAEFESPGTPVQAHVFPVTAARAALRRRAATTRPVVLDTVCTSALVPTDGTVLITGGLGAVGRHIARLLAEHGVPRLLLTARQGGEDPRTALAVSELAQLGAVAEVVACDVADPDAVAGVLAQVGTTLPLRGVVHCAGILDDGVIAGLTPKRLARVLRPKVDGAVNLHQLTVDAPLDLFLLLSSAAGVVGNCGQGSYAAANVFLDQLACHRQALGLAGTSLSFGAWAGEGLAAVHADLDRMAALGYRPFTAEQGRDLAALALRHGGPHLVAWSLDLLRVRASGTANTPLWRSLLPSITSAAHRNSLAERLVRLPRQQQAETVLALVREEVSHILGLGFAESVPADEPLRDLGMDSVTAVELRNRISARLGTRLPATLLFDHPTAARLAGYLVANALDSTPQEATPEVRPGAFAVMPAADEPIAIVAMACRLPGAVSDPGSLWQLVADGRDAVGPFPAGRWDVEALYDPNPDAPGKSYAREGGFLDDIASFDAAFFGITPIEAVAMDPQQRLLLETTWEALERAGIVPATLAGSTTGVYVGMFGSDYLAGSRLDQLDGYVGTGSALSVASGRLAYTLGLHGPALTVDTACSSSLVATHLAAQSLRAGECDLALAGGVTLMVTPQTFVEFSRLRGLSPTGRCRAFSDDADGAIWAEGAAMLVLKRLNDAERDGDEVLAVLRGTAVNQDGRSQGLSAPNGPAQDQVIRRALLQSGLKPADIDYVEAHGTGTALGDPIEAGALARVFGNSRPHDRPLYLGSLKSNIGHVQAASGVAGLIKVVESMRHQALPRTLHAKEPSRHVDWDSSGLQLLQEPIAWPATPERVRRAGVSAFGISGTNAHIIVEEAPSRTNPPPRHVTNGKQLFVLSARSEASLRGQAARLAARVTADTALPDVAHALARHRSQLGWRTAMVTDDRAELVSSLTALASGRTSPSAPRKEGAGRTAFVFPGHGVQWAGMGLGLLSHCDAFDAKLAQIDESIRRQAGWSVLEAMRAPQEASPLGRTEYLQPVLFAFNAALAATWQEFGVVPDAVVGHSLGEIAAAYTAGALTLEEAVTAVTVRAEAVSSLVGHGGMLAVQQPHTEVEKLLAPYADRLFVGAVNSPDATAVSGESTALAALHAQLKERGIPARLLSTPFASHSPFMESIRDRLFHGLSGIRGNRAVTPFYSSVLAEPIPGDDLDAAYWFSNLRQSVRFADTIRRMLSDGYRSFVELSTHPSLLPSIAAIAADAGTDAVTVASLRRGDDGQDALLRSVGELFVSGHTPDWAKMFPGGRHFDLPTYAFARERHWLSPAQSSSTRISALLDTHIEASDEPGRDLFQTEIDLSDSRFAYLTDHRVTGEVWLPGAVFLNMVLEAAAELSGGGPAVLADVEFVQPLRLVAELSVRLQLVLRPAEDGWRDFTIASASPVDQRSKWERHVTGRIASTPATAAVDDGPTLSRLREVCTDSVDLPAVYAGLAALGIDYGPAFRGLQEGTRDSGSTAVGRLATRPAAGHLLHPAMLDAAFQTAALPEAAPRARAFVPAGAERLRYTGLRTAPAWASCELRSVQGDSAVIDVSLWDDDGQLILAADGLKLAALSPLEGALFEVGWQDRPAAKELPEEGTWLLLADTGGVADELARRLEGVAPYVVVRQGSAFSTDGIGQYILDTADPDQMARLLHEAFADTPPVRVVQMSALDTLPVHDTAGAEEAARLCCLTTLSLVRALTERARRQQDRAPRLFVVVRGSQAAGDSTDVTHPQQALAWGFALTVAQEHPELATTVVDLPSENGAEALWTQVWHADDERLVALRDTGRLVPRLTRTRLDDDGRPGEVDGVHLVTGGLGGLGRVVAERLVDRGVRQLALMGRGVPDAAATAWIQTLEKRGVAVHLSRADVADRAGLTTALDLLRREAGPVAAIVHAAGVVDDATLASLSAESVRRVLAPKVLGAVLLTELAPDAEHLVLFASAAGLLGSAGQGPYSAANAFLDAWAHHLARFGRRALSLDWGAWDGVGMVAASGTRAAQVNRSGLIAFSPQDGGHLFERVLSSGRRQLAPIAFDRKLLARGPSAVASHPLLGGLVTIAAGSDATDDLVKENFTAGTEEERAERLESYVRARIGDVSGGVADISATALKEIGLDSLMLVRLRNAFATELGISLPVTDLYSAPDIRSLAGILAENLIDHSTATGPAEDKTAEQVPGIELWPATRDVLRLLRSTQPNMPQAAHAVGLALRLGTPVTKEWLCDILDRLSARHAALRTAIVTGAGGTRQLRVDCKPSTPLLLWTKEPRPDATERLQLLLEQPFDFTESPLWRFELVDGGSEGQVLVFGAHHVVSDLQSLLLVAAEIDAELSGTVLDATPTNRDIALLVDTQQGSGSASEDWQAEFEGCERLDLAANRPRPHPRSYRCGSVTVPLPHGLMERVSSSARRLAVTPAAFCLGTLTVLLARAREREKFVLAVPVDTRIHANAESAVGFFGIPVPFPAQAKATEKIADVLHRTDSRLERVLARGAMFSDVLATLARQGLHRTNGPLIEVYFNYVRFSRKLLNLEVLPTGVGHTDLDLMMTMTPDAGAVRLDYNLDILDAGAATELGEAFVQALAFISENAAQTVGQMRAPVPSLAPRGAPQLALAATFTAGNLPLMCEAALEDEQARIVQSPYHQVLAAVQDPSGVLSDPATAMGIVLLRAADLERFGAIDDIALADLRTAFRTALTSLAIRTGRPLIVGVLPTACPSDRCLEWERAIAADLDDVPGIAVVGPDDWTRNRTVEDCFDERTERLAHLPFTPNFEAAVALKIAETVRAIRRPAAKVIAVDGDETLWGGVAGERGPRAVDLTGSHAKLARKLLQWRDAGVLLALVTNNDEATVRAVLERPESLLKAEHFSVLSTSWSPKPDRLAEVGRTLGLGLDSFLFLDDNPAEIARMRSAFPQVLSLTCPPTAELGEFLSRLWPLVPPAATVEDTLRAGFYEQERERDTIQEKSKFEDFLTQLNLQVDLHELTEGDVTRGEQLIRRTNQFTLRARSRDGSDLAQWRAQGEVWTATARDRFGDYGQIALLAYTAAAGQLNILGWLMSCRSLGRGVEERLLAWLADRADQLGCTTVRVKAQRTSRNIPARRLLAALGGGDPDSELLDVVTTPERLRAFRSWDHG
ncbi:SDR family NAD(P)-dependent oxidoreductase [Streptomyces sp. NPDC055085]